MGRLFLYESLGSLATNVKPRHANAELFVPHSFGVLGIGTKTAIAGENLREDSSYGVKAAVGAPVCVVGDG